MVLYAGCRLLINCRKYLDGEKRESTSKTSIRFINRTYTRLTKIYQDQVDTDIDKILQEAYIDDLGIKAATLSPRHLETFTKMMSDIKPIPDPPDDWFSKWRTEPFCANRANQARSLMMRTICALRPDVKTDCTDKDLCTSAGFPKKKQELCDNILKSFDLWWKSCHQRLGLKKGLC